MKVTGSSFRMLDPYCLAHNAIDLLRPIRFARALLFVVLLCHAGCMHSPERRSVALGDAEAVMLRKMKNANAQNVTNQTRFELYQQITLEQKYYWWEMPDKAITGILLAGDTMQSLKVATIEIGEPNLGVAGTEHWRDQKLQRTSSIDTSKF